MQESAASVENVTDSFACVVSETGRDVILGDVVGLTNLDAFDVGFGGLNSEGYRLPGIDGGV